MYTSAFDSSDRAPLIAGLFLGLLASTPATAFTPKPGAILSGVGVHPNVLFLIDPSYSPTLADGQTNAVGVFDMLASSPGYRFGVLAGGELRLPADDARAMHMSRLRAALASGAAKGGGTLSLAEAHYEASRYMRGLKPFFTESANRFTSPVEYRCQANAVAVLTGSSPVPGFHAGTDLGDPDGDNPSVTGDVNIPNWRGSASPYLPSELARFAFEIDLRSRERHGLALDAAGKSWDDSRFIRQRLRTFVLESTASYAPAITSRRLETMAQDGGGQHWLIDSPNGMSKAIPEMLADIASAPGTAGRGAVSSRTLTAGETLHYRIEYDLQENAGRLIAAKLDRAGQPGAVLWSSDDVFTAGAGGLFQTWSHWGGGRAVTVTAQAQAAVKALSEPQQALLVKQAGRASYTGNNAAPALLEWARGEPISGLRPRTRLLGDVVNSPLRHSSTDVLPTGESSAAYRAYRARRESSMTPSLIVGANDGLLHVFDAGTGKRRMSFLPSTEFAKLGRRANPDYSAGTYLAGMDGPLVLADAFLEARWSTIAVAGMGAGGKGLVALELFNEGQGDGALGALWEKSSVDAGWQNLGYSYAAPGFAKLKDGRSVVLLGNGYGSESGAGSLLVVDAATGAVIREIAVPSRSDAGDANGLSSPLVRRDSTGVLTSVYAGDLHGRLWKFDLSTDHPSAWDIAFAGRPLFTGRVDQPIAVQPTSVNHPLGGELILFTTGKFLEQRDVEDTQTQAIHGVWDKPAGTGGVAIDDLQQQRIRSQPTVAGRRNRLVSQYPIDWASQRGWTLPLTYEGNAAGERAVGAMAVRSGRLVVTTGVIHHHTDADPCEAAPANGWLMTIEALTGGMLSQPSLDNDGKGEVDELDSPSAGLELDVGLPGDMQVIVADGIEHYLIQGTDAAETLTARAGQSLRRIMWRQLM